MCCLDCKNKQKSKNNLAAIFDESDKEQETLAGVIATAKMYGMDVQEYDHEKKLTPEAGIGNINAISKLKGLHSI